MLRFRNFLLAGCLALCAAAGAQFGMPGFKMPSMWYNPALVMDPAVQTDLHLTQPVVTKIQGVLMEQAMKMMPAIGSAMKQKGASADTAKMVPQFAVALDKMQKACTDNLTPTQLVRLHQITLQSYGPQALLDPKVGSQVGLTTAQSRRLAAELGKITRDQQAAVMKMMSSGGSGMGSMKEIGAKNRKAAEAVLASILTPQERLKWTAMKGKPLKLTILGGMLGGS